MCIYHTFLSEIIKKMSKIFDAIDRENFKRVKRIITENPNCVHVKDEDQWTPLDVAIADGHLEIAKFLFGKGGRPSLEIYRDGKENPLHVAAEDNTCIATLEWVFTKKVLPFLRALNIKNKYGPTPLDIAIAFGNLEIAKFFFEKGGRPNLEIYSRDGDSYHVHDAARWGYTATLKWVFAEKILPLNVLSAKNCDGCTPLDRAIDGKKWMTAALLRHLLYVEPVFLAMQRAKRDYHQMSVLRRLPNELLDMVVDEVAVRYHLEVVWSSL